MESYSNGLSRKQRERLDLAVRAAEASEVTQHRHGAVVVKGGRVLSIGLNKWRNQGMPTTDEYNPYLTVHAEIDALSRVKDARGTTLYIAQVNRQGEEKMSRPCDNCAKAIQEAGVKAVVYTVN